jgi:hypothetical protein
VKWEQGGGMGTRGWEQGEREVGAREGGGSKRGRWEQGIDVYMGGGGHRWRTMGATVERARGMKMRATLFICDRVVALGMSGHLVDPAG